MLSTLLLGFLFASPQSEAIDLSLVTFPPRSNVDVPLSPNGQVEVRREATLSRVKVEIDRIDSVSTLNPSLRAYIVWAVSPEGEFENIGELEVDGREAELETTTTFDRFGIIVTAEPHFMVDAPNRNVGFRSQTPRDEDIRIEPFSIDVGAYDYSAITLPPQGSIPARVTEARMAYRVAESAGATEFAEPELRKARVSLDSMEELLRRNMPLDVVLPYVNDSIRLSALAARIARAQAIRNELAEETRRAELLEQQNLQMEQELQRLDQRQEESEQRLSELRLSLQTELGENRSLELELEETSRTVRSLENEVARLGDPWPPLRNALMFGVGARETARGLTLTLPASYFESNSGTLEPEGRESLSRLAGILGVEETPQILIEGHTQDSGPASRNLTLSEDRAEAVKAYLFDQGISEDNLQAEGLGTTRPIAGNDDPETRELNERVELLFREVQNR
jgi:outer membrane protein OmpA-like peptidoglycan-associated protein